MALYRKIWLTSKLQGIFVADREIVITGEDFLPAWGEQGELAYEKSSFELRTGLIP